MDNSTREKIEAEARKTINGYQCLLASEESFIQGYIAGATEERNRFYLPEAMEIQYHASVLTSEQFREYWDSITPKYKTMNDICQTCQKLSKELASKEEEIEQLQSVCNQLLKVNIANMYFDEDKSEWKKLHKVNDGEHFIDYYMRVYAVEMEDYKKRLNKKEEELKRCRVALDDVLKIGCLPGPYHPVWKSISAALNPPT